MKHKFFILLVTGLAAVACAKETRETGGDEPKAGINFATRLEAIVDGKGTRGSVINTPGLLAGEGGFNVWAFEHSADWSTNPAKSTLMNGIPVTSTDGVKWSYGTEQEWPMGKYLSFFAYGPIGSATVSGTSAADGTPVITFAVDDDIDEQVDLLVAKPMTDQSGTMYSSGGAVPITFNHALSRIAFSALMVDANDTRKITIKSITLNKLYKSGSTPLTYPAVWTVSGDPDASYTVSTGGGLLNRELGSATYPAGVPVELTDAADYLFLMPQPLARGLGEDPTMDVVLTIDDGISPAFDHSYASLVFSPAAWVPGKSYNYQIVIDGSELRIIYIDSDTNLTDWSSSIVLQTIPLTSDQLTDRNNLIYGLSALNAISDLSSKYSWFGIYAVNDVSHDIYIDVGSMVALGYATNFTEGQNLVFDVKKLVRNWETDDENNDTPWKVTVTNYNRATGASLDYWELRPAIQQIDAYSGATLYFPGDPEYVSPRPAPSNVITSKGSIIVRRTNVPY